jgi:hypothetical protein
MSAYEDMYYGALLALDVPRARVTASELAQLTKTDEEAFSALRIMRQAPAGDRVRLALEWLEMRRHTEEAS